MTITLDTTTATLDYAFPRQDETPDTFPPGRRCEHDGCITILHRYHRGPWCHAHEGRYYAAIRAAAGRN